MTSEIVRKSVSGTLITLTVTGLRFGIGFGSQFVLARLLFPEHFGVLAFSWTVVGFLSNFTSLQAPKFLIKTKGNIEKAANSAFTLELLQSLCVFVITLLLAPWGMSVLGKPDQTILVQVLALSFFYSPFLQLRALLERQLDFKRASIPDVSGIVAEAIVAIAMAFAGFGVWSLVWGRLSKFLVQILIIWKIAPYHPRFALDPQMVKEVMNYSWPLVGAAVLVFFYWNVDYYIVGTLLGEEQLGYYWLAFQMTHYALQAKNSVNKVVYPAFCNLGSDKALVRGFSILSRYTAISVFFPCIVLLLFGEQIIDLLFGVRWLPATRAFQVLMIVTALRAVIGYWDPVFMKKGKTKVLLGASVINSLVLPVAGYVLTRSYGITGMSIAVLFTMSFIAPFLMHKLKQVLDVEYFSIFRDPLLVAGITLVTGWGLVSMIYPVSIWLFLLDCLIVTVIYVLLALLIMRDLGEEIPRLVEGLLPSRKSPFGE